MLEQNVIEKLRSIIADVLEVEHEQVQNDVNFMTDLGADSLRVIEILTRIEESLGTSIDQSNLARMVSLGAVTEIVGESRLASA